MGILLLGGVFIRWSVVEWQTWEASQWSSAAHCGIGCYMVATGLQAATAVEKGGFMVVTIL